MNNGTQNKKAKKIVKEIINQVDSDMNKFVIINKDDSWRRSKYTDNPDKNNILTSTNLNDYFKTILISRITQSLNE